MIADALKYQRIQIGATGLRTDREKGVANIRTSIKQQVGVVTETDDQGNPESQT